MDTGMSDGEKVDDIFSVTGKFLESMGESEYDGSDCPVTGN